MKQYFGTTFSLHALIYLKVSQLLGQHSFFGIVTCKIGLRNECLLSFTGSLLAQIGRIKQGHPLKTKFTH